jgi:hypothetical protein
VCQHHKEFFKFIKEVFIMKTTKSEAKVNTSTEKAIKFDTKSDLKAKLKKLLPVVVKRDDALAHTIDYALGRAKTTRDELADLFKQVDVLLSKPVAENQVKPKKPTAPKNKKVKEEEPTEDKPKKKALKKTDEVEEAHSLSSNSLLPSARIFPETLEVEGLGKLTAVPDKYMDYKTLKNAIDEGQDIYFATYWTPKHIKEYDYAGTNEVNAPKNFPNNLDLLVAVVPCETIDRVWAMSQYTEAMYRFDGDDFEPVEDIDPITNETYKVRVSGGLEFEIYELVSED